MAKLKIDFSDIRKFEAKLRKEVANSENNLKIGLLKCVTLVHREAVNNTREGVLYLDGVHEKGNLRRALSFDVPSIKYGEVFISKGLDYPKFVEMGTRRMRAKPFLTPAVKNNIGKIKDILGRQVEVTLNNLKV